MLFLLQVNIFFCDLNFLYEYLISRAKISRGLILKREIKYQIIR